MSNSDATNSWTYIQDGVRETERLIGQKQYNLAMLKARQTLEGMVKYLSDKYQLPPADLSEVIDELYKAHAISKATCEHYHKIRIIGNKAAHENDNNAYNASTAYHLLSQEVYTFANDYSPRRRTRSAAREQTQNTQKNSSGRNFHTRSSRGNERTSARSGRFSVPRGDISIPDLLKFIIPVIIIIIIVIIVKSCTASKKNPLPETVAQSTQAVTTAPTTVAATEALTTEATTAEAAQEVVYKTTSSLRIRNAPSTDAEILNVLPAGTTIVFIKKYDDKWTVINYNGAQAYVASEYLTSE